MATLPVQYRLFAGLIFIGLFSALYSQEWISTQGPQGGEINTLVLQHTTVFAGTDNGIWKSANKGESWQYCSANARIIRMCVLGRYLIVMTENDGVWRSGDDGATWEMMNVPIDSDRQVDMVDAEQGVIVAGTSGGTRVLFISQDSGTTWIDLNAQSEFPRLYGCRSLVAMNSRLFMGSDQYGSSGGVIRSSDSGRTWQRVNDGASMKGISLLATIDTILFAGCVERTADEGCIFRSLDKGVTWEKSQHGLPQSCLKRVNSFGVCGTLIFAAVHEYTIPSYIAHSNYIYCSDDFGVTWRPFGQGLPTPDGNCFLALPDRLMLSVKCGGVFTISVNDSVWHSSNIGLSCMPVSGLSLMDGNVVCSSFYHFVFERNGLGGWQRLPVDLEYNAHVAASGNTVAIAGRNGVALSVDNGKMWAADDTVGVAVGFNGAIPSFRGGPLRFHEGYVFCAKWDGIFRTRVSDMNTEHVFESADNTVSNEDWYFFTGVKEMMVAGFAGRLLFSNDTGATWHDKANVCTYPTAACFPDSVSNSVLLIAEYDQGVYRSVDGGTTWSPPVAQLQRINTFASWNGVLFAATKGQGVHVSYDTGATWTDFNAGLNYIRFVTDLLIDDSLLYAGTDGAGVWVVNLQQLGSSPVVKKRTITNGGTASVAWRLAVGVNPKNGIGATLPAHSFDLRGRRLRTGPGASGIHCVLSLSK